MIFILFDLLKFIHVYYSFFFFCYFLFVRRRRLFLYVNVLFACKITHLLTHTHTRRHSRTRSKTFKFQQQQNIDRDKHTDHMCESVMAFANTHACARADMVSDFNNFSIKNHSPSLSACVRAFLFCFVLFSFVVIISFLL